MDHDGVIRRSDDANSEMMRRGTSAMMTDGAGAGAYWEGTGVGAGDGDAVTER